jgi:D-sedoheptulose 7-phosphate isomerase
VKNMQELIKRYPALADCREEIKKSAEILVNTYKNGGKVITCGNGGSSADADHIVGELMNKNPAGYGPKITQIVEKYLGKGKKLAETTPEQAEFVHLILTEIKEDLM